VTSAKIVKLDKKYLPDLGLAPVATSGSYNDLEDTPTIYTDVVRYGNHQNLTTVQKTQARINIGAASMTEVNTALNNLGNTKVDKVDGKGLSTCDYSTEEQKKLADMTAYRSGFFGHGSIIVKNMSRRYEESSSHIVFDFGVRFKPSNNIASYANNGRLVVTYNGNASNFNLGAYSTKYGDVTGFGFVNSAMNHAVMFTETEMHLFGVPTDWAERWFASYTAGKEIKVSMPDCVNVRVWDARTILTSECYSESIVMCGGEGSIARGPLHERLGKTTLDGNGCYSDTWNTNSYVVSDIPEIIVVNDTEYQGINLSGTANYGNFTAYGNISLIPDSMYDGNEVGDTKADFVLIIDAGYNSSTQKDEVNYYLFSKKEGYQLPEVYSRIYFSNQLDEKLIPDTITRTSDLAPVATTGSYNDLNDKPCSALIENVTWLFQKNNEYSSVKQQVTLDDGTKVYYILYGVTKYTGDYVFLPDSLKKINIQTADYEITSMHEIQISDAKIYYIGNSSYLKAFAEYNYNNFPQTYGEFKDLQFSIGDGNFAFMAYYLPAKGYWDCVVLSKNGTNTGTIHAPYDKCTFQFGLYQTLDEKLIPSTIARTEDIPSIEGFATETYVDTKVSDLVNAAPEALDTLKELSAALGDDPNFATTVLTELGNKANKTDIKQADWNQSDENDNSYVRNRTHYVYVEEKVIVPETTAATTTLYSGNGFDIPNPSCENPFIEGGAYIVTWNGVDYNVIATADSSATALYVQENGLLAVGFMPDEPNIIRVVTDDALGTVNTLKVICRAELVSCLDEKYIPDTIARKSDIENFESNVQPDWNQHNETEPDYIKNRPFYYRTKTYELTGISQQISSSYISLRDLYDIRNTEIDFDDNKSYRVTLDITGSLSEEENNINTLHCEMTPKIFTYTNYGYSYIDNTGTANLNGIEYKYELIIVDASEGGNVRLCLNTTPSGKSQLVTDIKIKIEETKNLEEYVIPDTIARTENIPVIDTTLTVSGAAADAKAVGEKILSPKHYITMIDQVNGRTYILSMEDGNLVSKIGIKHISVTTPPNIAEYTHGEYFDPTGMIVTATYYDDTTVDITGYTCPTSFLNSNVQPKITYTKFGITYEAIIPITINVFDPSTILVDFNYVDNKDGTYTLVGWKGTYNGEPSDKLIIPDYACIII
jgi:hypothetical protein